MYELRSIWCVHKVKKTPAHEIFRGIFIICHKKGWACAPPPPLDLRLRVNRLGQGHKIKTMTQNIKRRKTWYFSENPLMHGVKIIFDLSKLYFMLIYLTDIHTCMRSIKNKSNYARLPIHGNFLKFLNHIKSSSFTSRELRQQFAACSGWRLQL